VLAILVVAVGTWLSHLVAERTSTRLVAVAQADRGQEPVARSMA
jgi:hypothetical protein